MKDYTEEEIKRFFSDYVVSKEDKERHSAEAVKAEKTMEDVIFRFVDGNIVQANFLSETCMDTAIEFEESGFVAGFKWCLQKMKE